MRTLFDQYSSPENRLTHALACCLERDRRLLRSFVRWMTHGGERPSKQLQVYAQEIPGEATELPEEDERRGLPDIWIVGPDSWALLIEGKVTASLTGDQLRRHAATAKRNGFRAILGVLAAEVPKQSLPDVYYRTWQELYCWLKSETHGSTWANEMGVFLEAAEIRMGDYLGDKVLTDFAGIPFTEDRPYSYREAKRILRLLMERLRNNKHLIEGLEADPDSTGRSAITGTVGDSVWDFLSLKLSRGDGHFTEHPHLTLSIRRDRLQVQVTLPHRAQTRYRKNLLAGGLEHYCNVARQVATGVGRALRHIDSAYPWIEVLQRHYLSQRSHGEIDARLSFNLHTSADKGDARVKYQPEWLQTSYAVLANKKSNLQISIGGILPYGDDHIRRASIADTVAEVWLACAPWLKLLSNSHDE